MQSAVKTGNWDNVESFLAESLDDAKPHELREVHEELFLSINHGSIIQMDTEEAERIWNLLPRKTLMTDGGTLGEIQDPPPEGRDGAEKLVDAFGAAGIAEIQLHTALSLRAGLDRVPGYPELAHRLAERWLRIYQKEGSDTEEAAKIAAYLEESARTLYRRALGDVKSYYVAAETYRAGLDGDSRFAYGNRDTISRLAGVWYRSAVSLDEYGQKVLTEEERARGQDFFDRYIPNGIITQLSLEDIQSDTGLSLYPIGPTGEIIVGHDNVLECFTLAGDPLARWTLPEGESARNLRIAYTDDYTFAGRGTLYRFVRGEESYATMDTDGAIDSIRTLPGKPEVLLISLEGDERTRDLLAVDADGMEPIGYAPDVWRTATRREMEHYISPNEPVPVTYRFDDNGQLRFTQTGRSGSEVSVGVPNRGTLTGHIRFSSGPLLPHGFTTAISPSGERIATLGEDNRVRIWTYPELSPVATIQGSADGYVEMVSVMVLGSRMGNIQYYTEDHYQNLTVFYEFDSHDPFGFPSEDAVLLVSSRAVQNGNGEWEKVSPAVLLDYRTGERTPAAEAGGLDVSGKERRSPLQATLSRRQVTVELRPPY